MKAYKAFNSDLSCNGFKFEVGKTFRHDGEVVPCKSGFHCCEKLKDVYNYYSKNYYTRVCEVEVVGDDHKAEGDKICCREIKIVRELSKDEIKQLTDDFKFNSGNYNSGDYNSGNLNSGYRNSGNYNSGDYNSGNLNSGDYNSGNLNSGDYNSGNYNSGYRNSGNYNSGDYNSGNYNSGYFNSNSPKVRMFNSDTDLDFSDLPDLSFISEKWKPHLEWVWSSSMTDDEKKSNPSHETTGGFLRRDGEYNYKKSWRNTWDKFSDEEVLTILTLPNFDPDIFLEITGIDMREE